MPTDFIGLFSLLVVARVRFVVVGGLAVLLHGVDRLTADVDLAIDLSTDATLDAVRVLTQGGYRAMARARNCWTETMANFDPNKEPSAWGSWEDAEALRRWSFARRTPDQRLAWLVSALELAYQSGAIKPRRPDPSESSAEWPVHPADRR